MLGPVANSLQGKPLEGILFGRNVWTDGISGAEAAVQQPAHHHHACPALPALAMHRNHVLLMQNQEALASLDERTDLPTDSEKQRHFDTAPAAHNSVMFVGSDMQCAAPVRASTDGDPRPGTTRRCRRRAGGCTGAQHTS
eukprot:18929-Rhodomonas_salina.7